MLNIYIHICLVLMVAPSVLCVADVHEQESHVSGPNESLPLHDEIVSNIGSNLNDYTHKSKESHDTMKNNIAEVDPVDELTNITKNITNQMNNDPFFKLPQLDRKIRELALLHPTIMEKIGVYVIPIKEGTGDTALKADGNSDSNDASSEENDTEDIKKSDINDILQKTEMTKAMSPEDKLQYIPQLKETIIYEILKSKDELNKLWQEVSNKNEF